MNKSKEIEMVELSYNMDASSDIEIVSPSKQAHQDGHEILRRLGSRSDNIPEIYDHLEKMLFGNIEQKVRDALRRKKNRTILHSGEKRFPEYELITKGFMGRPSIMQRLSEEYGDPFNFKCLYDKKTNKYEIEVSWREIKQEEKKRCSCVIL